MVEKTRIVVTGAGCLSPLGADAQSSWEACIAGQSGAGPITLFDASEHKTRIAAEVKDFDPVAHLGRRAARRMDRFTQMAVVAAGQALSDSGVVIDDSTRERIGVIIGSGIGGIGTLLKGSRRLLQKGPRWISPFMIPMMLPDTGAGQVAIQFGLRGPNMAIVTACASSTNAIGEAAEMIRRGAADVILAGGAEAGIVDIAMAGFNVMEAISTRNDEPERASRPFDLNRDGFLAGEGATLLVLETLAHATARGANIMAEIVGYAATNDAFHITAPAENGHGAAACMRLALEDAGLERSQIDYINAHGTSTALNDSSETAAVKTVFGDHAYQVAISSTKSMTGHLLGAAGGMEALFCIRALQEGILPPTINYETPDPVCDLDYIPNTARKAEIEYAMSNSFGFGGHNATLILRRFTENGKSG